MLASRRLTALVTLSICACAGRQHTANTSSEPGVTAAAREGAFRCATAQAVRSGYATTRLSADRTVLTATARPAAASADGDGRSARAADYLTVHLAGDPRFSTVIEYRRAPAPPATTDSTAVPATPSLLVVEIPQSVRSDELAAQRAYRAKQAIEDSCGRPDRESASGR